MFAVISPGMVYCFFYHLYMYNEVFIIFCFSSAYKMFASTIGKASSLRSKFCRWRHMQAKKKKNSTTLNFLHLKNLDDQLRIASQICCPQSHVILHQTGWSATSFYCTTKWWLFPDYAMARSRWLPIAEQWKKNLIQTGVSSVSVSKSSMELQQAFSDGGMLYNIDVDVW